MLKTIKKIIYLLKSQERKKMSLIIFMMLLMAILDMIGVASILPFMAVLSSPNLVETNLFLKTLFEFSSVFGVENKQQFLFALGGGVLLFLVVSLTFKAFTIYIQVKFVSTCEYTISRRLIEGYLHQPYSWFLNRNSANLGKIILSEVGTVTGTGLLPLMNLIARGMITLAIIFLLIIVDPKLTLIIALIFGTSYSAIFFFMRRYLGIIAQERLENEQLKYTAVSEAFGAAKEVKVGGLEQVYTKKFSDPSKIVARNSALASIIVQLPRFFLEAIAFGGIILLVLYLMRESSLNSVLPIISLYALAGYRLMPALQEIYASFSKLITVGPSVNEMYEDLKSLKPINFNQDQGILPFYKDITLKNIHYNYPNSSRTVLKDININIKAKTTIGLVGTTGSGKTTIVDIILGLLEPQKGALEVDGQTITKKNLRSWQNAIGYVPQYIYLSDETIAENIAFGEDPKNINQERIEKVSKIANLHNFINNELSKKYKTKIGERGVRLSGGQRQRIGIARALYHNPSVLVLDEATSALDNQTEEAVMDAVNSLNKDITIILIAHRLNTVSNCETIFKLEKGQLVGQGTFEELITNNKNF
tara:strand:+ start:517 stop:2289 length:1773 start_codon:yes stop_codon:yes gene_type:complete